MPLQENWLTDWRCLTLILLSYFFPSLYFFFCLFFSSGFSFSSFVLCAVFRAYYYYDQSFPFLRVFVVRLFSLVSLFHSFHVQQRFIMTSKHRFRTRNQFRYDELIGRTTHDFKYMYINTYNKINVSDPPFLFSWITLFVSNQIDSRIKCSNISLSIVGWDNIETMPELFDMWYVNCFCFWLSFCQVYAHTVCVCVCVQCTVML